jgi:hypothetical protein
LVRTLYRVAFVVLGLNQKNWRALFCSFFLGEQEEEGFAPTEISLILKTRSYREKGTQETKKKSSEKDKRG